MSGEHLAVAGLATGAGVLTVVATLLVRTLIPTREIDRYAGEIATTIQAISRNVGGGAEIVRTRELAQAVPPLVNRLTGATP